MTKHEPIKVNVDNKGIQSVKIQVMEGPGREPTNSYMYFDRQENGTYKANGEAAKLDVNHKEIYTEKELRGFIKEAVREGELAGQKDVLVINNTVKNTHQTLNVAKANMYVSLSPEDHKNFNELMKDVKKSEHHGSVISMFNKQEGKDIHQK